MLVVITGIQAVLLGLLGMWGGPRPTSRCCSGSGTTEIVVALVGIAVASMALGLAVSAAITNADRGMPLLVLLAIPSSGARPRETGREHSVLLAASQCRSRPAHDEERTMSDETYTSTDGQTYDAQGSLLTVAAGTPASTSYDTDHDGYYESTATDADGDGYAETASADENADGYDEYALSDHDADGSVDEVVLDTDADGWGDAAITEDGAPYGESGTTAVLDTDGDGYADVTVGGL